MHAQYRDMDNNYKDLLEKIRISNKQVKVQAEKLVK
jgi:hypothetical protein